MVAFDINAFVSNPTLSQFDKCRKSDLCEIAEHHCIPVSSSLAKAELKAVLLDGLVSKGVFSFPASVENSGVMVGAMAAVSLAEGRLETVELYSCCAEWWGGGEAAQVATVCPIFSRVVSRF